MERINIKQNTTLTALFSGRGDLPHLHEAPHQYQGTTGKLLLSRSRLPHHPQKNWTPEPQRKYEKQQREYERQQREYEGQQRERTQVQIL